MWTNISANKKIDWRWWAPDRFKILLYYPESNSYAVSGICERYAYDSYFTVDMKETDLVASYNGKDSVAFITSIEKNYPYPWGKEILSLLARVSITVALEVGIALLFRLRQRKTLLVIIMTNVVTQILLNVALNIYVILYSTDHRFIFLYMMLELLIFISEATVYCLLLN